MVGFNLPNVNLRSVDRCLPSKAIGPPFFYYENVAIAPKGVWTTISRFLYDIQPEFVDSRFLCAAARKRGYIHNLPIENRSPLLPLPPKTIFEAFPHTKRWWPSWDPRKQFNCLLTNMAKPKLTEQIHRALAKCEAPPPRRVQKYVLETCRTENLVWVGLNKVAHLEPDEMEFLLGFPKDHTRGIGRTERFKSLGNSFHVDTVAYHLSALRDMFPHGMNVLSLFSGIGGAEVALHRLGIRMKTVVSVEISEVNRFVLRTWWNQTQTVALWLKAWPPRGSSHVSGRLVVSTWWLGEAPATILQDAIDSTVMAWRASSLRSSTIIPGSWTRWSPSWAECRRLLQPAMELNWHHGIELICLAADLMGAPGFGTGITISSGRRVPWLWLHLLPVTILYFVWLYPCLMTGSGWAVICDNLSSKFWLSCQCY